MKIMRHRTWIEKEARLTHSHTTRRAGLCRVRYLHLATPQNMQKAAPRYGRELAYATQRTSMKQMCPNAKAFKEGRKTINAGVHIYWTIW